MIAAATYTPAALYFDAPLHRYTLHGRVLISVTTVLRLAGLSDAMFAHDEAARERGVRVHAAIALLHERPGSDPGDASIAPFVDAYRQFLADAAFRIDACEERLADPDLGVAGTLDLRGEFVADDVPAAGLRAVFGPRIDILDVKTGTAPAWVGYQTAGYVRLLPPDVRARVRRWCLQLSEDGRYRLIPLSKRGDATVFLAAVTVAQAKQGWA